MQKRLKKEKETGQEKQGARTPRGHNERRRDREDGGEGQKTEPGGERMMGEKTKETEGVQRGREMNRLESHKQ